MNLAFLELGLSEFNNSFSSVMVSTPQYYTVCNLSGWEYLSLVHIIMMLHITLYQLICIPQDHQEIILGYSRKQIWGLSRVSNNTWEKGKHLFLFASAVSANS